MTVVTEPVITTKTFLDIDIRELLATDNHDPEIDAAI